MSSYLNVYNDIISIGIIGHDVCNALFVFNSKKTIMIVL